MMKDFQRMNFQVKYNAIRKTPEVITWILEKQLALKGFPIICKIRHGRISQKKIRNFLSVKWKGWIPRDSM